MSERKIPALMRPFPQSPVVETAAEKKVTARVENIDPDTCPICKKTLVLRVTKGLNVKACLDHNIVMPIQD